MLAHEITAQHQDNRRAFVTTNDCFTSKATKISSLSWRRTDRFPAQNGKDQPNPRAARARQEVTMKIDIRENRLCIDRSIVRGFSNRPWPYK